MANSWNGPQLGSPIRTDVPELQKKLIALLKQDPTSVTNIPSGAKRLVNTSGTQWQVQQYNGSSWAAIGKLMHDVDKLDGYHAAITPAANTVAVRNADKKLEGDITGNAATASSAATLSETLPVNKGGTGATTSEAARTNLGVPPTSHTSTDPTYGVGNATQYGHLKLSDTTDSASGVSGGVAATPAAAKAAKDAADAAQSSADAAMTKASTLATASTPGIVKPGTGMTVDAAGALNVNTASTSMAGIVQLDNTVTSTSTTQGATANAVKMVYDKAVKVEAALPAGIVIAFAANSAPSGYLICNGAEISRTTYAALFAAIGTTYGAGDGWSTFALPNLTDRFIQGSETAGMEKAAGVPNLVGNGFFAVSNLTDRLTGVFARSLLQPNAGYVDFGHSQYYINFNASDSNGIYGASTTVQPPALTMRFYIKY